MTDCVTNVHLQTSWNQWMNRFIIGSDYALLGLQREAITRSGYDLLSITSKCANSVTQEWTHWGRVTHICVDNLTIIVSDNGLSPGRRQAIIWNNAGILLIGPLETNFSDMLADIITFSFKKMYLNVSSAKWWPFCFGRNVLKGTFYCSQNCIIKPYLHDVGWFRQGSSYVVFNKVILDNTLQPFNKVICEIQVLQTLHDVSKVFQNSIKL